jgi:hypothetical protein
VEKQNQDVVTKVDTVAPLTMEQMTKLLLQTLAEQAKTQKQLAEAILESRKPYVDPKVLADKQRQLEERRKQIEMDQRIKIATKKVCPHTRENGTSNIKWMEHSNGIILGVCGTCNSQFCATGPDAIAADANLLRTDLKSRKNMGRAGQHARLGAVIEA